MSSGAAPHVFFFTTSTSWARWTWIFWRIVGGFDMAKGSIGIRMDYFRSIHLRILKFPLSWSSDSSWHIMDVNPLKASHLNNDHVISAVGVGWVPGRPHCRELELQTRCWWIWPRLLSCWNTVILTRRDIMYHPASRKLMMYPGTDSKLRYTISCFTYVCTAFTARVGNEVSVG